MKRLAYVFSIFLFALPAFAQDIDGSADHPMLGRFEGAHIVAFESLEFDEEAFLAGKADGERDPYSETHEGATTRIQYHVPAGSAPLQVLRGFEQKLTSQGFEVAFKCTNKDNKRTDWCGPNSKPSGVWVSQRGYDYSLKELRILYATRSDENGKAWVQVSAAQSRKEPVFLSVVVVEDTTFENKIIDAEAVSTELTAQGKMAFYDILFETGSADLKPSSDATLQIISEVIQASGDLKVIVVGHTDNQGELEFNITLSQARARAVKDRLVGQFGVTDAKVSAAGVAFLAPVTSNVTAEGRALNRRVEIVVR